eukprot:13195407-Alexandrium_andersonii.AAC.1
MRRASRTALWLTARRTTASARTARPMRTAGAACLTERNRPTLSRRRARGSWCAEGAGQAA